MFFVDTRDILFLVLSVSIVVLLIFLVIALYHLIKILRNLEEVSEDASHTSGLITKGVDAVADKVSMAGGICTKFSQVFQDSFEAWTKKQKRK